MYEGAVFQVKKWNQISKTLRSSRVNAKLMSSCRLIFITMVRYL